MVASSSGPTDAERLTQRVAETGSRAATERWRPLKSLFQVKKTHLESLNRASLWAQKCHCESDFPILETSVFLIPVLITYISETVLRILSKLILLFTPKTLADPELQFRGPHGERGARAYNGVWGWSPSGVQGQSPWSGGQGAKPPWSWKHFSPRTSNGHSKFAPLARCSFFSLKQVIAT